MKIFGNRFLKASLGGCLVNRRKDGSKYLADLLITLVVDNKGKVTNFLGIQRDATQIHRLECEVADQKALTESVVDAAPVVIALLDSDDFVVLDNHEYKKLMADLRMTEPATLILNAVCADLGGGFGEPQEGEHAFSDREIRIETPGAPRWFSCSGIWVQRKNGDAESFFQGNKELYLLLLAKETTRLRAEQEKTRMALLQAVVADEGRVDDLRETLSAAVFKLERPFNVMASAVSTLERRGVPSPASKALADAVWAGKEAVETLRSVIPEHLPESRIPVNVNEVVRDVLDITTRQMLSSGITVFWSPQVVMPSVGGCPNRLRSMFKALVDNAIEAMNVKGWKERELSLVTRSANGNVEILIEDSGPGIAPELRYKVFEPFFSTRNIGGRHLGTGLSTAQQVASDHDGFIEIDPEFCSGCRVRVVLPGQVKA